MHNPFSNAPKDSDIVYEYAQPPNDINYEDLDPEKGNEEPEGVCIVPNLLYWKPMRGGELCEVGNCEKPAYTECDS